MNGGKHSAGDASPYLGLRPFEASDAPFFFGRRREVSLLAANLRASRTTLVYGESGVGKSSLLRAGLGPELAERSACSREEGYEGESFAVVLSSMGREDPLPALRAEVASSVGLAGTAADSSLLSMLQEATRVVDRLLIVLDHFEQYLEFMGGRGEDRFAADFVRAISRPELPVHFLVAIREDAISRFDRFGAGAREITANPVRIEPLKITAAREAISEPLNAFNAAHRTHLRIEEDFEREVIAATQVGALDLGFGGRGGSAAEGDAEGEIEAAYLQLALKSTFEAEREHGSSVLRLKTFEKLGGVPGIVRNHLDSIMGTLDRESQRVALGAFRYLVTPSGMKVPYSAWDLSKMTGEKPERIEKVLSRLSEGSARIVRPLGPSPRGDRRYEIYHDRLGDPILDWCRRFARGDDTGRYFRLLSGITSVIFGLALAVLAALGVHGPVLVMLGGVSFVYGLLATPLGGLIATRNTALRRFFGD